MVFQRFRIGKLSNAAGSNAIAIGTLSKVEADSEETLDLIEDMLRNKGFLVEDRG